jgi:hypothetical protein
MQQLYFVWLQYHSYAYKYPTRYRNLAIKQDNIVASCWIFLYICKNLGIMLVFTQFIQNSLTFSLLDKHNLSNTLTTWALL